MLIGLIDLFSTIILRRGNMVQITTIDNFYYLIMQIYECLNVTPKKVINFYFGPPFRILSSPRSYFL